MADVSFATRDGQSVLVRFVTDLRTFARQVASTDLPLTKIFAGAGQRIYLMRGYTVATTTQLRWRSVNEPDPTAQFSGQAAGTVDRIAIEAVIVL